MSNKDTSAMNEENNERTEVVPRLRFPEFREAGEWATPQLQEISIPVDERVGDRLLTPVSISAGVGFVSQAEKFGRDISGSQYRLYTLVRDGDFVYNKGNSLKFPQGCVYDLQGWGEVAAPNVFICFHLKAGYENGFFRYYFEKNVHGLQLKKHITSGARSNGLLNISRDAFFGIKIPTPEYQEQQKIAGCLSSLDELITAENQRLDALKAHKKGLTQRFFPREGETAPRLRHPGFRRDPQWISATLGDVANIQSGGTPARINPAYWNGDIPWVTTSLIDPNTILKADEYITKAGLEESSAKIFPKGTLLMAMYGQGKTRGKVSVLGIDAATNQACAAIILKRKGIATDFVFQNLASRYEEIRKISNSGGQENLSAGLIEDISFSFPENEKEQKYIVSTLSSIDELIINQSQKIDALKTHKKGLMQQLFPAMAEVEA